MKTIMPLQLFLMIGFLLVFLTNCQSTNENKNRMVTLLDSEWKFINEDVQDGEKPETNTADWETVTIPHDWAISGEFDKNIDIQEIMVIEDGERVPRLRTGRTGGLPHPGVGWYRKSLNIPKNLQNKRIHLEFDGAMSHARIYLNGSYVGEWPYGYASFGFDVTDFVEFGKENLLAVRLDNKPLSSRWYPGAGIYRDVRLVVTSPIFVRQWGTYITTPNISEGDGTVNIETTILNKSNIASSVTLQTEIVAPDGETVASNISEVKVAEETMVSETLQVEEPILWSVESPALYKAVTKLYKDNQVTDTYETTFGFRYFRFTSDQGFFLNGEHTPLQGVCLHHDLGPLGAAFHVASMKHRMKLLKEMGCNAIRTTHNPYDPKFYELANQMGFLVINEAFDEWKYGKTENGYNILWDEWAEKDMVAFIHRDRNHPSVIAWSVGNEVREQHREDGAKYCRFLVDICKREDPTRPTTAGFNFWQDAIKNGFADIIDLPGWNYAPDQYQTIHEKFPRWKMYGSETASTVSSRGEYFFPVKERKHYTRVPHHSSSFDMEFPNWANSPDTEFAAQDAAPFMAGEFVWTGIDYLGEPTPFNVEWPARSSYFGIIDLCGIPKDRFYLYQSRWTDKEVLHLLPHWNWEEGQNISVHCYTNFHKGELFLNGKSLGIREKDPSQLYTTYRWVWDDVIFEPGELKVVALDENNNPLKEKVVRTAGKPAEIILKPDRMEMNADGKDLVFVTVSVVDKNGVLCPDADNLIDFKVKGQARFKAVGSGDPTSLESFVEPYRKVFNGKCMLIIQSSGIGEKGKINISATSDGLTGKAIEINAL